MQDSRTLDEFIAKLQKIKEDFGRVDIPVEMASHEDWDYSSVFPTLQYHFDLKDCDDFCIINTVNEDTPYGYAYKPAVYLWPDEQTRKNCVLETWTVDERGSDVPVKEDQ